MRDKDADAIIHKPVVPVAKKPKKVNTLSYFVKK
jgi:hypothetical protein